MKLNVNKNLSWQKQQNNKAFGTMLSIPRFTNKKSFGPNFTSSDKFAKVISKGVTTYTNFDKISENVNNILGDNFFTTTLQKAKLVPTENNELVIKNSSIVSDILKTAKYPFVDMPRDLLNSFFTFIGKAKPFKGLSQTMLNQPFLKNRANTVFQEKNRNLAFEILNGFSNENFGIKTSKNGPVEFNLEKCANYFKEKASEGVTKTPTNYSSRDERALNRIATGLVSATFGGWDFYNISMLQKDDPKEAKNAQCSRFRQEASRMIMNAGANFFTMGVFNKYIKNSMPLNILVIGITTALTEVISRLINKTPLVPLTPEQAARISDKKENENNSASNNNDKVKSLPLKGNYNFNEKNVFGKFLYGANSLNAIDVLNNQIANKTTEENNSNKNNKKKIGLKEGLILAFTAATAIFTLATILKGNAKLTSDVEKVCRQNHDKIKDFIDGKTDKLDDDIMEKISEHKVKYKATSDKFKKYDLLSKFKTLITQKNKKINLTNLKDNLVLIKNSSEGSEIEGLLDKYISYIDNQTDNTLVVKEDRRLASAVYSGFTKIIKTVYQIFSLPGMVAKSIADATVYKDANELLKKLDKLEYKANDEKNIAALNGIIEKSFKNSENTENAIQKASKLIKKNVRNFSDNPETGELANYARTCVTVISSYFFINDYRNRVLIESKGKDVEKAEIEKNTRLAHKLANFVINGTLMNLFNSVFKGPLNRSLFWAGVIPTATEITNETLVRKFINQPILPRKSKQEIIDYETKQMSKKGILNVWSKAYRKLTGKKALSEKAGISTEINNLKKDETKKQTI